MVDSSVKLGIACDHAGFETKEFIKLKLSNLDYQIIDFGTHSTESVDYPEMIHPLASAVNRGDIKQAVIICGSGNGVAMVANKYPNVRAAVCWNDEITVLSRQHNDANVISIPARFISQKEAFGMTQLFLNTSFEGGRHQRRVEKISKIL